MTTTTHPWTTTALRAIDGFGTAAHTAIGAVRTGGERLGDAAADRWDRAFAQARGQLSAETRRNATNARKVAARYWQQGLAVSTDSAERAVDAVVGLAGIAVQRADALRQARAAR